MSRLKAIFIRGPPVLVDAAIRAFRRMQSRRNKIPEMQYIDPCMADWSPWNAKTRLSCQRPKPEETRKRISEETMKRISAIARGVDAEMSMLESEQEYKCSLRAFKAEWKEIQLCEEPRY